MLCSHTKAEILSRRENEIIFVIIPLCVNVNLLLNPDEKRKRRKECIRTDISHSEKNNFKNILKLWDMKICT